MVAYLLCAGFGTRMRPLTRETPKSLLSVGGRPLLDHLLDNLREAPALSRIHVAVNHRHADRFRSWAEEWRPALADDASLHIHDDGVEAPEQQLGAVGDLRFLLSQTGLPPDGAVVSGGDSLYRFPFSPLLAAFDGTTPQVLALHEPDPQQRRQSSTLRLDGSRVQGLVEDPTDADSTRICPSWYLLPPDALTRVDPYLEAGGDPDTLGIFIDALAREGPVAALRLPDRRHLRLHCNTPADLEHTRRVLEAEPRYVLDADEVRETLP